MPFPARLSTIFGIALFTLAMTTAAAQAQRVEVVLDTTESVIHYTGSHPLHSWRGSSHRIGGTLRIDPAAPAQSRVELHVPVASFDSGNSNRDSNMLDVVEVERYPDVRFTATQIVPETWTETGDGYEGTWQVTGDVSFHGQTHPVTLPVAVTVRGDAFEATGTFTLSLDRYDVRRPKLMLMSIRDELELESRIVGTLRTASMQP